MSIIRIETSPRMSQAVIHGDTIYLAGQVGAPGESVATQTEAALEKISDLLTRAGSNKNHILSAQIWLADIKDFAEMNKVWDSWIAGSEAPVRATGEARLGTDEYQVEIIIIAAKV